MKKKDKNQANIKLIAYGLQGWEIESSYAIKLERILLNIITTPWYKSLFMIGSVKRKWKQEFERYLSKLEMLHNNSTPKEDNKTEEAIKMMQSMGDKAATHILEQNEIDTLLDVFGEVRESQVCKKCGSPLDIYDSKDGFVKACTKCGEVHSLADIKWKNNKKVIKKTKPGDVFDIYDDCIYCGTKGVDAKGIGLFCPNKNCKE